MADELHTPHAQLQVPKRNGLDMPDSINQISLNYDFYIHSLFVIGVSFTVLPLSRLRVEQVECKALAKLAKFVFVSLKILIP